MLVGADVEELERMATRLEQRGVALRRIRREVDAALNSATWHGDRANAFRRSWTQRHGAAIDSTAALAVGTARIVRHQAAQQRHTSATGAEAPPRSVALQRGVAAVADGAVSGVSAALAASVSATGLGPAPATGRSPATGAPADVRPQVAAEPMPTETGSLSLELSGGVLAAAHVGSTVDYVRNPDGTYTVTVSGAIGAGVDSSLRIGSRNVVDLGIEAKVSGIERSTYIVEGRDLNGVLLAFGAQQVSPEFAKMLSMASSSQRWFFDAIDRLTPDWLGSAAATGAKAGVLAPIPAAVSIETGLALDGSVVAKLSETVLPEPIARLLEVLPTASADVALFHDEVGGATTIEFGGALAGLVGTALGGVVGSGSSLGDSLVSGSKVGASANAAVGSVNGSVILELNRHLRPVGATITTEATRGSQVEVTRRQVTFDEASAGSAMVSLVEASARGDVAGAAGAGRRVVEGSSVSEGRATYQTASTDAGVEVFGTGFGIDIDRRSILRTSSSSSRGGSW